VEKHEACRDCEISKFLESFPNQQGGKTLGDSADCVKSFFSPMKGKNAMLAV
jgi:hypothetical protein